MIKIYTAEEWFDNFYPKSWGDWRKEYNIKKFREHYMVTHCTWMDYPDDVYLSSENEDGLMKVNSNSYRKHLIEKFFISCGECSDDHDDYDGVAWFIQPYMQPKDKTHYASVRVRKKESNLDLYEIYISGFDDSSYTKHFLGLDSLNDEVKYLKENGIMDIQQRDYFFTN